MADTDVRDLLRRYQEAIDRKEAETAVACFADDVIAYDLAPPLVQDPRIVRDPDQLQQWFETWQGPLQSAEREAGFSVTGDLACVIALRQMRGTKVGGEAVDLWYRSTTICKRVNGNWKIVHIHASTPFAMDGSDKALLHLTP